MCAHERSRPLLSDLLRNTPYFKGKARLLHTICPRDREVDAELFGYRVRLDLRNHIERSAYLGVYEPWETRAARSYLKPGMTFFDVGANVGYYTLLASQAVGSAGLVYAFEPGTYPFERLSETLKANRIENVRAVKLALGAEDGEAEIGPFAEHNRTSNMIAGRGEHVTVTTVDRFVERHAIGRIDFLKMDVDGFEPFIIEGGRRALTSGAVRAILCEFCPEWLAHSGLTSQDVFNTLVGMGFRAATPFDPEGRIVNVMFVR